MDIKRFSPRKTLNKTNIEKTRREKPTVYKLLNAKGKNIYTGVAKRGRVEERLKEHLADGQDPISGAKFFQIRQMTSIKEAKEEEAKIIKKEKPKFNQ